MDDGATMNTQDPELDPTDGDETGTDGDVTGGETGDNTGTDTGAQDAEESLLRYVKTLLSITWDDEHTDARIGALIENARIYLDDKLGEAGDYTVPGYPRTLLAEYVRYARDEALDVFENNYQHLILAMQHQRGVNALGTAQTAGAAETGA